MTTKSRAEAALLGTTLIWGGTFAVVKIGMQDMSPILLIAVRFLIASVLFFGLFWKKILPLTRSMVLKGSVLGLFLFLGFVAQNIGLTYTTASKSAFITGLMVVFVPFLQFIIERRSPRLGNLAGVAIVTVGLWLLTSPAGSTFNVGDALTIACAVLFAVYIVYIDVISREMTTLQLTSLQMVSTCVYSWIAVALFETPVVRLTGSLIGSMLYLTFLATALTTYVQTRFQKDTTPTRAVVIFTIEPVFASIVAGVLLGEQMGPAGMLGGGLILAGVLVSELSDNIPVLNWSFDQERS
jgi:drug/metabolite transporter (DMT)-like permease